MSAKVPEERERERERGREREEEDHRRGRKDGRGTKPRGRYASETCRNAKRRCRPGSGTTALLGKVARAAICAAQEIAREIRSGGSSADRRALIDDYRA